MSVARARELMLQAIAALDDVAVPPVPVPPPQPPQPPPPAGPANYSAEDWDWLGNYPWLYFKTTKGKPITVAIRAPMTMGRKAAINVAENPGHITTHVVIVKGIRKEAHNPTFQLIVGPTVYSPTSPLLPPQIKQIGCSPGERILITIMTPNDDADSHLNLQNAGT